MRNTIQWLRALGQDPKSRAAKNKPLGFMPMKAIQASNTKYRGGWLRHFSLQVSSVTLFTLCFTATSAASNEANKGHDDSSNGSSCFVQFGGTGDGRSADRPYGSLQEVENDSKCKIIHVLPALSPLDGGITLKRGQQLIGIGDDVNQHHNNQSQPMITNTVNAETFLAGPAVRLADHSAVKNIKIMALSIGILGDNVTDITLNNLLIEKATSYPASAVVGADLCDISNAVYRGCEVVGVRNRNGAIHLLADDLGENRNFNYKLKNINIKDIANSQRWSQGVHAIAAGDDTQVIVNLEDIHVENTGRAYVFYAYNTAKLTVNLEDSSSKNTSNDALVPLTSFFTLACPTCPTSDPTMIVNINGFSATPQPANGNEQQGIEMFSFEPNTGTHELHIANTSLSGFSVGFFVWNLYGYPKSAIYDLGCLNPNGDGSIDRKACKAMGYTSIGKNRIYGNDVSTIYDPGYSPGLEILTDGQADIMAQNNYWGPNGERLTVLVDGVRRCGGEFDDQGNLIRDVPPYRCQINQGSVTTGFGTINDDFPR